MSRDRTLARLPWRALFIIYAIILATLTHWPGVAIEGPIPRPDLVIHIIAFSIWTVLCALARLLGDPAGVRGLGAVALVSVAYAALDEWTQPLFNRHASWDDFFANLAGVGVGVGIVLIAARARACAGSASG